MKTVFGIVSYDKTKNKKIEEIYNLIFKSEDGESNKKNIKTIDFKDGEMLFLCFISPTIEIIENIKSKKDEVSVYSGLPYFSKNTPDIKKEIEIRLKSIIENNPANKWFELGDFMAVYLMEKDKVCYLLRDPFGTIPLYMEEGEGWFAFSNNLRILLKIRNKNRNYNNGAIANYLRFSYFPGPSTIFSSIKKLPAMNICKISKKNLEFINQNIPISNKKMLDIDKIIDKIEEKVTTSVEKRLNYCKKPVLTLTGGFDSTTTSAIVKKIYDKKIDSIIGFAEGLPKQELELSRIASDFIGTKHHEVILKPKDAADVAKRLMKKSAEPIGDTAAVTALVTAEYAKKLGDVVFAGNGGDEQFVGYNRYRWGITYEKIMRFLPKTFRYKIRNSYLISNNYLNFISPGDKKYIKEIIRGGESDGNKQFFNDFFVFKDKELIKNYTWADFNSHMIYDQLFLMNQTFDQQDMICRYPLLDLEFVDLTFQIPANLNITKTDAKVVQRLFLEKKLQAPKQIINRKKQGFGAPLEVWMRDSFGDLSNEIIPNSKLIEGNIIEKKSIEKLLLDDKDTNRLKYYFTMLSLWLEYLPKQIGEQI